MLGDFLREVAALILVFVPLDVAMGTHMWRRLFYYTLSAFSVSGVALWYGVILERGRFGDGINGFRDAWRVRFGRFRRWFAKQIRKDE